MRSFFFSRFVFFFLFFFFCVEVIQIVWKACQNIPITPASLFFTISAVKETTVMSAQAVRHRSSEFPALSLNRLTVDIWGMENFFVFLTWFLISLIDIDLVALVNLCAHKSTLFTDSLNISTAHKTFTPPSISLFPSRNVIILNSSAWWEEELLDVLISDDASLRENRSASSLAGVYIMEPRDF